MIQILIGTVAVIFTVCCFLIPIAAYRLYKQNKAFERALSIHSIIYCEKCADYRVGKYSLCTSCIKTLAQEVKYE